MLSDIFSSSLQNKIFLKAIKLLLFFNNILNLAYKLIFHFLFILGTYLHPVK